MSYSRSPIRHRRRTSDFRYTLGRAYQLAGDTGHAAPIYRSLYAKSAAEFEAGQARQQLQAMGVPLNRR